jgi:predicted dehydrogenase/threonine dehydrogenase-like Zn-dependent dehydrogenase
MKQVFSYGGQITVQEMPAPVCGNNEVLVQNMFSVISSGTESTAISTSAGGGAMSLVKRLKANPDLIKKGLEMLRKEGLHKTLQVARGEAEGTLAALGYSSAGIVIEVGSDVRDISIGDRVTCAGAGYACHAEFVNVPRNLICHIPPGVDFKEAAFTTLGAIAMQGVRRSQAQLGEKVAVIGLGLLGQITCQILKAAGASVIGIDPLPARAALARELGIDISLVSGENIVTEVMGHTNGYGADSVIICAATQSSEPAHQAMQMARRKGKIVVVGAIGMTLERPPFYEKELDFLISCSYGPGRYDSSYEQKGIDYPIAYVRWTENRNMQAFLELLNTKKVNVARLVDYVFAVDEAGAAYQALGNTEKRPVAVIFKYPAEIKEKALIKHSIELKPAAVAGDRIKVGVIGAGAFAQAFHLPNIQQLSYFDLKAVATRTGTTAKKIAEKYGAQYYTTDYQEVLRDKDINMVLIATRHNLHAPIAIEAAKGGKHVFVEKPLAMTYGECREVYKAVTDNGVNLTVGFNRRFSPLAQKLKRLTEKRKNPVIVHITVNSSGMKKEHWINDPVEGGGAIIGEGCHFFDLAGWLISSEPKRIYAEKIASHNPSLVDDNNIACVISYQDGSVFSLTYTTIGHESFPKERVEVFMDGGVALIDDFKELNTAGLGAQGEKVVRANKGQLELLQEFGKLLKGEAGNKDLPTVLDGVKATICSLKAIDALRTGKAQEFEYPW